MRRLAFFLGALSGGGAERMIVHLANNLAIDESIEVDLLVANAIGPYLNEVEKKVNLINFKSNNGVKACVFSLKKYFDKFQPLSVLSTLTHANIAVIVAAKLSSSNVKVCIRESVIPSNYFDELGRSVAAQKYISKLIYPLADCVVAVSEGVKEDIREFYSIPKAKVRTVYNPVIDDDFFEKVNSDHPNHRWIEEGKKVVIGMGRIAPQKDFKTLIRAFNRVRKNIDSKLIILGKSSDKKYAAEINKLINELGLCKDVDMPGFIQNPFPIISKATVFVLSSKFEGLPGVLIQAMGCGCPVVSTDCPAGPNEILAGGRFGTLVPVGDDEKMSEAILDIMKKDYIDRSKLINRSLYFHANSSTKKYLDILL